MQSIESAITKGETFSKDDGYVVDVHKYTVKHKRQLDI